jgi:hypothetical protein
MLAGDGDIKQLATVARNNHILLIYKATGKLSRNADRAAAGKRPPGRRETRKNGRSQK